MTTHKEQRPGPGTALGPATARRLGELLEQDVTGWLRLLSQPDIPEVGSALDEDAQATAPYNGWHITAGSVGVAVGYLATFRDQLGREDSRLHPHPPVALLRGALEASALAVWLVLPDECAVRRGRALSAWWSDLGDRAVYEKAEGYRPSGKAKSASQRQGEVRKIVAALSQPSSKAAMQRSTTQTILDAGEALGMSRNGLARLWSLSSGVAHGRYWPMIFGDMIVGAEQREPGTITLALEVPDALLVNLTEAAHRFTTAAVHWTSVRGRKDAG